MRASSPFVALAAALSACTTPPAPAPPVDAGCSTVLFGRPVAQTGLTAEECAPTCTCGGTTWNSRDWTTAELEALSGWQLETPFAEITTDPYAAPASTDTSGVCTMVVTDLANRRYRLETVANASSADGVSRFVTHSGACGVCSTLADLRVYAADPDLGKPVWQCGLDTFSQGHEANVRCLQRLGFTLPCAQIWGWNAAHTRSKCLSECIFSADAKYHSAGGALNDCLACDEKQSGTVFKAVAGRTRRNTGIASAICRPCAETMPIAHDYPPPP